MKLPAPSMPPPSTSSSSLARVAAESLPLAGEWRFAVDPNDAGQDMDWADPGFDDSAWTPVTVPHTWGVMEKYADYDGWAWYRRGFTLPDEARGAHLRLHFDGVFYLARVWLNGEYLGEHEGGYTAFEFDVSGLVQWGADNHIAVQVDNRRSMNRLPATLRPGWSFDWWNYGGIVRDVSVRVTSRAFIARQQIIALPHLNGVDQADAATVTTRVTIRNASTEPFHGTVTADVLEEATGGSALEAVPARPVGLAPGESADLELLATVPSPKLWHFDHPILYLSSVSLLAADGQVLHTDDAIFGIRLIELKEARLYLNGEPVRLVGLTRHADSPEHGLAETVAMMAADYDDLKRLNMVLSRPVHYPQHDFILDYCDRQGILLIPEVPAWQLTARQMESEPMRALERQQLSEMISAAFNHPSVWAWSVGNEIESKTASGHAFVQEMVTFVKSLDPTRPVGFASNQLNTQPQDDATALADLVMMNQYLGTWAGPKEDLGPALDAIHRAWPDKTVIVTEYGFEPHWNAYWGPHSSSLDPTHYYFINEDVPAQSEEADLQRRLVITEQMTVLRQRPFVAAAIFWTYQDYRTPSGFTMGVVDAARERRGSWAVLREEYAPLLFESVIVAPASGDSRRASVRLRTRGPLLAEMPVYTLRGYTLHWAVSSRQEGKVFSSGDVPLPTLSPDTRWSGEVTWPAPPADYILTLRIVRSTGFPVIECSYDAQGQRLTDGNAGGVEP
jgi:beta-glucuronidase